MQLIRKDQSVIPGFGLTMGLTLTYMGLIVLIPLSMLFIKTIKLSFSEFWHIVSSDRAVAALLLSFGAAIAAACINLIFGFLVAWVLARYKFPGKTIIDALVDLPFALPTAVAGIALTTIYANNGWIGQFLYKIGIHSVYSRMGVVIALIFTSLPFVVRTVQPVLLNLDPDLEEASLCLGANRWQTFYKILLPEIIPAALTGFALAFARALGEYGSVVFISGNMPMKTEIVPLLIMTKLEEYNYAAATALAAFMLSISFLLLLCINLLQWWGQRFNNDANLEEVTV